MGTDKEEVPGSSPGRPTNGTVVPTRNRLKVGRGPGFVPALFDTYPTPTWFASGKHVLHGGERVLHGAGGTSCPVLRQRSP